MTKTFVAVESLFEKWQKDPDYRAEYDALEDEFALASALIAARVL